METAIRIGKHLISPFLVSYIYTLGTYLTVNGQVDAGNNLLMAATMFMIFLGVGYGVAWLSKQM